jgi:hypothetical protein
MLPDISDTLILIMKTIHNLSDHSKLSVAVVLALFLLGFGSSAFAQFLIPDPPATPIPTYYAEGLDFGNGAQLLYVPLPGNPSEYALEDWDIATPDGLLTPANTTITGDTYGTPDTVTDPNNPGIGTFNSFFDVFVDISLENIQLQGKGPLAGDSYDLNMGGSGINAGSITDNDGNTLVSQGTWRVPDTANTLALLILPATTLAVMASRRKPARQVIQTN